MRTRLPLLTALLLAAVFPLRAQPAPRAFAERVEIRRTAYGVPHLLAEDLGALGYGLAWVQLEDHGTRVVLELVRARGELGTVFGRDSIEHDFVRRQFHTHAVATYHLLHQDTRDLMEGFAAAVNGWLARHPTELPGGARAGLTGHDVAALWVDETTEPSVAAFLAARAARARHPDTGSNAWAFAPSRTTSGNAILLRNPHLSWDAGYYEAHVTVPGVINFYGDFRVGHPLYFNGGFNEYLGWATTNNSPDVDEIYALDADPGRPDHYLFDGGSVPLERVLVTVQFRNGPGLASVTREFWRSPLGPVVERADGKVYVVRSPAWEEYRRVEQFLRMTQARSLAEWKQAVAMRAHVESNLTYADRAGNIFYIWNATLPQLPTPSGADTAAIPATRSAEVWTRIVPLDSIPQVLNPRGGYVQNSNDPFHYTNLNAIIDSLRFPNNFPKPRLGLRSQLALDLVQRQRKVSLEDVVRLKHDYRMLLADRLKDDLVAAVRGGRPDPEMAAAAALLERWDNTTAPDARGGTLFEAWFRRYIARDSTNPGSNGERWNRAFRLPWTPAEPTTTPRGLANPSRAVTAFVAAIAELKRDFGRWDVAWGDVHRVRIGDVNVPVGGCPGALGCFRVLSYARSADVRVASFGDAWVLAVEFADTPRAYSVLAYGQSSRPESPHHSDQAAMFARGELKRVAFTEAEIAQQLVRRYRPGVP
ncbi:MAG: penicillin acylase family protein [Gemmatimonadota bacterium]